jgi:hypothetical protein
VGDVVLQRAVVCQQQKALAVLIEPSSRIDIIDGYKLTEVVVVSAELTYYAKRFVEENKATAIAACAVA